jgi:hypothetical protein
MSHKHIGRSVAELLFEIEDLKTSLKRQIMDYLYRTTNPRAEIAANGVNEYTIADWMNNQPNGMVRVKHSGTVTPLYPPQLPPAIFSILEYTDQEKENEVGVSRFNQGLSPDTLNHTARGVVSIMNASAQRVEMIARIFAETGFRSLYEHILELTAEEPELVGNRLIRLTDGQETTITADEVEGKYDLVVSPGVGTDKGQVVGMIMQLMQVYREMIAMGAGPEAEKSMVSWENLYNAVREMVKGMGFKNTTDFINDPQVPKKDKDGNPVKPKQQQPSPEMVKLQQDMKKFEAEMKLEAKKHQDEMNLKNRELNLKERELGIKEQELGIEAARKAADAANKSI